jgi:hypothetical protein
VVVNRLVGLPVLLGQMPLSGAKRTWAGAVQMSAIGAKQTWASAPHMSAFGGKADMILCRNPLSRSLLAVKRTSLVALHMSVFDRKRTFRSASLSARRDVIRGVLHTFV